MDSFDSKVMVNTAWDLEDSRFMEVEATRRLRHPIDSTYIITKSPKVYLSNGIRT